MTGLSKPIYVADQLIEVVKIARAENIADTEIGQALVLFLAEAAGTPVAIDHVCDLAKRQLAK